MFNNNDFSEAFQELKLLKEEKFTTDEKGIEELVDFREADKQDTEIINITDPEAESEEDLKIDYIGDVILDCIICHNKEFKNADEVTINEEDTLANIGEVCPCCQSMDGFKIIGEVARFNPKEVHEVETDTDKITVEVEDKEDLIERLKKRTKFRRLQEAKRISFNKKSLKESTKRDNIDAEKDNKIERAKKRLARIKDDADSDKDYKLKKNELKEPSKLKEATCKTRRSRRAIKESTEIRKIKVVPGYYEWLLKVDDEDYYSFGDLGQDIDNFDNRREFADYILESFKELEDEVIRGNYDGSDFVNKEIKPLTEDEYIELRNALYGVYNYYMGQLVESNKTRGNRKSKRSLKEMREPIDTFKEYTFIEKTKQGYEIKKVYQDIKDNRMHIIAYRPDTQDYLIGIGYNADDGTWNNGRYDYTSLEDAIKDLKKDYEVKEYSIKTESCKTRKSRKPLKEEDMGTEIKNLQRDVDYDMKVNHRISPRLNRRIRKDGLQLIKDRYGDDEVSVGKYESLEDGKKQKKSNSNAVLILKVLKELGTDKDNWKATSKDVSNAIYKVFGKDIDDSTYDDIYNKVTARLSIYSESLKEDTEKVKDGKWVNKGKQGTHGTFRTKKEADAQRKAMFANGYKESLSKDIKSEDMIDWLKDHEQAYKDAKMYFKKPLSRVDKNDLISWIYDHKQLSKDFENFFKVTCLDESFDKVDITTDEETITIKSEPRKDKNNDEETIKAISPETEDKFTREGEIEDSIEELSIDDFDEETFDDLEESYLRKEYDNIKSYKTEKMNYTKEGKIILEGTITFKSGKTTRTRFIFEGKTIDKNGKIKLIGENKQFSGKKNAFTLTCNHKDKKLFTESLNYNYLGKDAKTNKSKRIYGTIKR